MGVEQVYPGRYTTEGQLALRVSVSVTFLHCVPTIFHMLLTQAESSDVDLFGWKVVVGGSALAQRLLAEGLACGVDVFAGYGMSETSLFITSGRVDDLLFAEGDRESAVK